MYATLASMQDEEASVCMQCCEESRVSPGKCAGQAKYYITNPQHTHLSAFMVVLARVSHLHPSRLGSTGLSGALVHECMSGALVHECMSGTLVHECMSGALVHECMSGALVHGSS